MHNNFLALKFPLHFIKDFVFNKVPPPLILKEQG